MSLYVVLTGESFKAQYSSSLFIYAFDIEVVVVLLVWIINFLPSYVYMRTMQGRVDQLHSTKPIPMSLALQYRYVSLCIHVYIFYSSLGNKWFFKREIFHCQLPSKQFFQDVIKLLYLCVCVYLL